MRSSAAFVDRRDPDPAKAPRGETSR